MGRWYASVNNSVAEPGAKVQLSGYCWFVRHQVPGGPGAGCSGWGPGAHGSGAKGAVRRLQAEPVGISKLQFAWRPRTTSSSSEYAIGPKGLRLQLQGSAPPSRTCRHCKATIRLATENDFVILRMQIAVSTMLPTPAPDCFLKHGKLK